MIQSDDALRDAARLLYEEADAAPADFEATRQVILAAAIRQKRAKSSVDFAVAASLIFAIASAGWAVSNARSVVRPWVLQAVTPVVHPMRAVCRLDSRFVPTFASDTDLTPVTKAVLINDTVEPMTVTRVVARVEQPRVRHNHSARSEPRSFEQLYHMASPGPLAMDSSSNIVHANWNDSQPFQPLSVWPHPDRAMRGARFFASETPRRTSLSQVVYQDGDPRRPYPITLASWQ